MFESANYPCGAGNDPRAPWNCPEPEPVKIGVEYSCVMRRTADVEIYDYIPGSVEKEWDGECYVSVRRDNDFSNTDFLGEWKNQNRTPKQLIAMLHDIATAFAGGRVPEMRLSEWKDIAADCENWDIEGEETETV